MGEGINIVVTNRKARHDYHIEDTLEAGIVLQGTEVKSIRQGKASLQEAYCVVEGDEMFIYSMHVAPYTHGSDNNHVPTRKRKLLLHKREIYKWRKASEQKGYTIVPLRLYFRDGYAKVEIGLAKGKKLYDKRADIAERETKRRMDREMRQY